MPEFRRDTGLGAIIAASAGNLLEWYDFTVYALFAVYIAQNFFPSAAGAAGLVKAFLVFGLGFVIRPLGAVLLGIYGDRAGRKAALTFTILLMACGTLIIAVAPNYAAIGIGAPLLVSCGRMLQGFSAGGEIGSATAYLVEQAPLQRRGAYSAWLQASMGMSNILGALTAFAAVSLLTPPALVSWGWRVPFVLGLSVVPVGVYLRRALGETPAFIEGRQRRVQAPALATLTEVFRDHSTSLLIGMGVSILWAVAVYVLLIFMPVYVQKSFGFSAVQAFGGALAGNVVFVLGCFAFGRWADRIGAHRVMLLGAVLLLLSVLPLLHWLDQSRSTLTLVLVQMASGASVAGFTSVAPMTLASLFPTPVRATGVSLVYNTAITIFGGFAPAILTWLSTDAQVTNLAPGWYVTLATLPAIVAGLFIERRAALVAERSFQRS